MSQLLVKTWLLPRVPPGGLSRRARNLATSIAA
jgi:hypothetical protein